MRRKRSKATKVSLAEIAKGAGISKAAVGYALQNKPGVSKTTRERVFQIAKKLGYSPDARIATVMTAVRASEKKQLLPIAWLNTHSEQNAWEKYKFLSPYLEGAKIRAVQLGYKLEEFWLYQPGMTMRRMSQILYQRGIDGVIVTQYWKHFNLNWNYLTGVAIETTLISPGLHTVVSDTFCNFLLAIKMLKRFGYRRIGVCLDSSVNRRTYHAMGAMVPFLDTAPPKLEHIPPLFYSGEGSGAWKTTQKQLKPWLHDYRPEVVVGHSSFLVEYIEKAGFSVPKDIGVIHLATDDDVSDWAGICANKREIGAAAVEKTVSQIQQRQVGLPKTPFNILVRGSWSPGRTLLIPKPKVMLK